MRYSNDLRFKVLDMIEVDKMKEKDIARLLHIHPTTIAKWHAKYKRTGNREDVKYKVNYTTGRPPSIEDMDKFGRFIKENNNLPLNIMMFKINDEFKTKITSTSIIHRYIKDKLGYAFKKSLGYMEKEMKN
jgi:transposase